MRILLCLLLFNLLVGCGSFEIKNGIYTQSEFIEYINSYLNDKEQYLGTKRVNFTIKMYFSDLKGTVLGTCFSETIKRPDKSTKIKKHIEIDLDFWNRSKDCEKKLVIYHELGHCDLEAEHIEEKLAIMNSDIGIVRYDFCRDDKKLIREFFNSAKDKN
ncbi:MAG: hypothetical protein COB41_00070 [Proteobacteria bacterium]|nr:MAG: hypothetical protein COB41_00070 [Pseudomonadota bacterium]